MVPFDFKSTAHNENINIMLNLKKRDFMKWAAGTAAGFPSIVPASVPGQNTRLGCREGNRHGQRRGCKNDSPTVASPLDAIMKNPLKLILTCCAAVALGSAPRAFASDAAACFKAETIRSTMRKVDDYAIEHPWREYDRDWIRATMYTGVMEAYHATGDETYLKQATAWAEKHHYNLGHEHSGFNRMFCTMTWLELYLLDPDPKKIEKIENGLKEEMKWKPEIGKIWYGHEPHQNDAGWVYADALYAAPAFAMLHEATGNQHYLDLLNDAFWSVTDKIFDPDENLYYRDPTYIGKKSPHGGKILWARGNGWVFAGLPRILKHLPKDDPGYDRYLDLFKKMAASLAGHQGDDGFWHANLGDAWQYRMPESSSTAFFTAGFAWGVKEGILDQETYLPVVIRGWDALNRSIHPDGFMGWIQPVDAAPRPSHPKSTQEYGVGLFLYAGAQVVQLVEAGIINPAVVRAVLSGQSQSLPPVAFAESFDAKDHPAAQQMNAFLQNQKSAEIKPTGLKRQDYLEVIAGQVKAMHPYQNGEGRIVDPVEKAEKYFTTPCYAHSVAVLAKAGYPIGDEIIESGMKALDVALADLAANTGKDHSDFFTWPMVLAMELFDGIASNDRKAEWNRMLGRIDPTKYHFYRKPVEPSAHREFYKTYDSHFAGNWNLVHSAGEWARTQHGFGDPWYVDYCLTMQLKSFTKYGMYNEGGNPLAYDLFARHYLNGMLAMGYDSFLHSTYRDILWRGAWTSLFMQSPFGEAPTGYRSTHHIWNEAEQAVIFEIYASAYAKAGKPAEAGAFKRAAHLSLSSIKDWIRPDGSGYVVKNRYPIEAKHGYERYTVHSCYNMLACSMLAQAWQFADDSIGERPAPADVGGFVVPVLWHFRKVFANVAGNYVEYDINGDHKYNPTGLLRVHLKDGHPQLGPSDGAASLFSGEGINLAVGPSWKKADGSWTRMADYKGNNPWIKTLEESADVVRFKVVYPEVTQTLTIDKDGVTVEDVVTAPNAGSIRVSFPMLVFDGKERTKVELKDSQLHLSLNGKTIHFTVLEPSGLRLKRSGKELKHRNGMVEEVSAEAAGERIVYRISN